MEQEEKRVAERGGAKGKDDNVVFLEPRNTWNLQL